MGEDRRASFAMANRAVRRRWTALNMLIPDFTKMNRSATIDSYLALDENRLESDHSAMLSQPYQLYVERTDTARNMARFYEMAIEPNLFGEVCLTRRWGRIGAHGQTMVQHFALERDAVIAFLELLREKRRRGYGTASAKPHRHTVRGAL